MKETGDASTRRRPSDNQEISVTSAALARNQAPDDAVVLVGAGAVNIVTALRIIASGRAVLMLDSGPDPRLDRPWQEYGCTRGGANARMFTATEADQYSGLAVSEQSATVFEVPPSAHGWDVRRDKFQNVRDQEWIREYKAMPTWLPRRYETDIYGLNRSAGEGWERLFEDYPELGRDTDLHRGILRLYSTQPALHRAVRRHREIGDLTATFTAAQVRERFPAFAHAQPGALAGGIGVCGFTLDIHRFIDTALHILERRGVHLRFGTEVTGIHTDSRGAVAGLRIGSEVLKTRNVVISPGAYGHLLEDLGLGGRIAGVLGVWHTLPNLEGQSNSVKVSRPGAIAEDANISVVETDGRPSLVVGSGYGFTGTNIANIDPKRVQVIQRSVDEMMKNLLPDAYEAAGGAAWLEQSPRYCVRPWTATSLGLYDVRPTASGGQCIVTGGHNTGGFTQAPEVAAAVVATFNGNSHRMHYLYSSRRTQVIIGECLEQAYAISNPSPTIRRA